MKIRYSFLLIACLLPVYAMSQSDQHYTMFMYNKLLYNPGYAGSRDVISANAIYRDQWGKISGAPKTMNLSVDAPISTYMKPFRPMALGLSMTNETVGVEQNIDVKIYYAYRVMLKNSVLSFGLSGGINLYSASYDKLILFQQNDPNFSYNINNAMLPNFGAGVYWSSSNYYCGFSAPNILENYYDKHELKLNDKIARQIRSYYLSGGYVYSLNSTIKLVPQLMIRYAINSDYRLPINCDINLSAIAHERILFGFTYRTDKSMEVILHVQVTKKLNFGYSYDYLFSALNGYNGGTHEIILGYDFVRDISKFVTPRFIKKF